MAYVDIRVYIYIYIYRERERERLVMPLVKRIAIEGGVLREEERREGQAALVIY